MVIYSALPERLSIPALLPFYPFILLLSKKYPRLKLSSKLMVIFATANILIRYKDFCHDRAAHGGHRSPLGL